MMKEGERLTRRELGIRERKQRELAESVNENWGRRENELLSKCLYKVKEIIFWNRKNKKLLIFCFEVYLTANIQPDRGRGK